MNGGEPPPRATVLTGGGVVALVLLAAIARPGAGVSPFVVQVAELALAGGAAYLLDDAAAPLTTVTPRGLWQRRARGLAGGAALLAGAWAVVLLLLAWQASRPPLIATSGELTVLCLGSLAAAAVLFRRGDPQPGVRVAPVVVLTGVTLIIAGSMLRETISMPGGVSGPAAIRVAWVVGGLVAAVVLAWASRDPAGGSSFRGTDHRDRQRVTSGTTTVSALGVPEGEETRPGTR